MSDPKAASGTHRDDVRDDSGVNLEKDKDSVSYETFRKVLGEKKKRDEEIAEKERLLEKYQRDEKRREEDELKKKQDWQKVIELREQELEETRKALEESRSKISEYEVKRTNAKKLDAVLKTLKAEVDDKYWIHFDLDSVVLDPMTGAIDGKSVSKEVERFKREHPTLIARAGNLGIPDFIPQEKGSLTYEQWRQLPVAEMKKRWKDVKNSD